MNARVIVQLIEDKGDWELAAMHCRGIGLDVIAEEMEEGDPALALEWLQEHAEDEAHAEFTFINGVPDNTGFLERAEGEFHILFNAARIEMYPCILKLQQVTEKVGDTTHLSVTSRARHCKSVVIDSGQITVMGQAAKAIAEAALPTMAGGKRKRKPKRLATTADEVVLRMDRQVELLDLGWTLATTGVPNGVLFMMDMPVPPDLLDGLGIPKDTAIALTLRNAAEWLELFQDGHFPPGWKPCFVTQGQTLEEYAQALHAYDQMGILNEVRAGHAWLAIGSARNMGEDMQERISALHRQWVGPHGHIHLLGVGRKTRLRKFSMRGLINSADAATASIKVGYNKDELRVEGVRTASHLPTQFTRAFREQSNGVEETVYGCRLASLAPHYGEGQWHLNLGPASTPVPLRAGGSRRRTRRSTEAASSMRQPSLLDAVLI